MPHAVRHLLESEYEMTRAITCGPTLRVPGGSHRGLLSYSNVDVDFTAYKCGAHTRLTPTPVMM